MKNLLWVWASAFLLLAAMASPSMALQAPPNPPAFQSPQQGGAGVGEPAAAPVAVAGRPERGNISATGHSGDVMVDANITLVQISVEVRSQPLGGQGEWSSGPDDQSMSFSAGSADSASSSSYSAAPGSPPKDANTQQQSWQSANSVQLAVSQRSEALITYLQSVPHLKQLKTVSMSLRPLERWHDGQAYNYGWVGTHSLSFEVDAEHAGQYIDESIKHGATRIDSVSMKPRDEDAEAARREAIKLAARNALSDAALVLEAMGLPKESMRVADIQVDPMQGVVPFRAFDMMMPMAASAEGGFAGAQSKVVGGQQAISARVTVKLSFDQGQLQF